MTLSSPAPAGSRNARGRATRSEIVQAAISLFAEVGFHGASLRELAKRAGLSHPGLLYYFPTKEALLTAVLEHRDEIDAAGIREDLAQGRSELEAMLRLIERNQHRRVLVDLYVAVAAEATAPEHPAHDYFVKRYEDVLARAEGTFRAMKEAGELRDEVDPAWAAQTFIAMADGLQVQWLLLAEEPGRRPVDMAACLRRFVDGLRAQPPGAGLSP